MIKANLWNFPTAWIAWPDPGCRWCHKGWCEGSAALQVPLHSNVERLKCIAVPLYWKGALERRSRVCSYINHCAIAATAACSGWLGWTSSFNMREPRAWINPEDPEDFAWNREHWVLELVGLSQISYIFPVWLVWIERNKQSANCQPPQNVISFDRCHKHSHKVSDTLHCRVKWLLFK